MQKQYEMLFEAMALSVRQFVFRLFYWLVALILLMSAILLFYISTIPTDYILTLSDINTEHTVKYYILTGK